MGLDLFDVLHRIEQEFGVALSDDDLSLIIAERDIRAGALCVLVEQRRRILDQVRLDLGINRQVWEELRAALAAAAPEHSSGLDLSTALEAIFPRTTRREAWDRLRTISSLPIPELEYPRLVQVAGWTFALLAAVLELAQFRWQWFGPWRRVAVFWLLPGLVGLWMVFESRRKLLNWMRPWRTSLPRGMQTVKDLCRGLLATRGLELVDPERALAGSGATAVDLWPQMQQLLADVLGVKPEEVVPEARLFADLGMD